MGDKMKSLINVIYNVLGETLADEHVKFLFNKKHEDETKRIQSRSKNEFLLHLADDRKVAVKAQCWIGCPGESIFAFLSSLTSDFKSNAKAWKNQIVPPTHSPTASPTSSMTAHTATEHKTKSRTRT